MNIKHILSATAIAFASAGAFASEATQFTDLGGNLSRADVKAELAIAQASGALNRASALYGYFEPQVASVRSRDDVRAEARMAAHSNTFNPLYSGA
ncbi:MAG: hypothetical protein OEY03_01980 [Rhizobacter sp.]|nr:hypothetical protein [Rhizobacter sp.]